MFPIPASVPATPITWSTPAIQRTVDSVFVPKGGVRWDITGLSELEPEDDFGLITTIELQKTRPEWQIGIFTAPEGRYLDIDIDL